MPVHLDIPCAHQVLRKMDIVMSYVKNDKKKSREELFLARNFVLITHDTKYIGLLTNNFGSTKNAEMYA